IDCIKYLYMTSFISDHFLLQSDAAQRLYHNYAKTMPIIDYHCHLPPDEIAADKTFDNLSEIWLAGDHYKWRAMRTFGIDETTSPERHPIKRSFTNGLRPSPTPSATRSTTGLI